MSGMVAGNSTRRKGNDAMDRVNRLVEEKLDNGLEYEALQLYKGQAARKAARNDIDGAASTAKSGAAVLIRRGFVDSASELTHQIVQIFKENQCAVTEERLSALKEIDALYSDVRMEKFELKGKGSEAGVAQAGKLQAKFLKAAISWTVQMGPRQHGDASLNASLGRCLFSINDIRAGAARMVAGESPIELVALLDGCNTSESMEESKGMEWSTKMEPDQLKEHVLFLSILHFLSLCNLRDANVALDRWTMTHPESSKKDLIRFCRLLCKTCEYDAAPMFRSLSGSIKESNDPAVDKYLAQIGKVFFNILPPPSMLDGILNMLGMN